MKIVNEHDGSVEVSLSNKLHGHTASVTPLTNGLIDMKYMDELGRKI